MSSRPPRVGLFGYLGSGNIGNDASMESVLHYLRTEQPTAVIDAMCMGPARVREAYGLQAVPLSWARQREDKVPRALAAFVKVAGKFADAVRVASWVRRHDVVIVPGMGVLETTLPLKALGAPYAFFLLSLSGRLFGTKVALVSVGANVIRQPLTRKLYASAARLACYVSYRDAGSLDAMRAQGAAAGPGLIYPDLAFGIPPLTTDPGDPDVVGIGVMEFHGTNDDRGRAAEIGAAYLEQMTAIVGALVDRGRTVRLFVGDTTGVDRAVIDEITAAVRSARPGLPVERIVAEPVETFTDLMRSMAPAGAIVATRYHNLICALLLGKPTISVGYSAKHQALMAETGLEEYCQPADGVAAQALLQQLARLERKSAEVRHVIAEHNADRAGRVAEQFAGLSALLFPAAPGPGTARQPDLARIP